MLVIHMDPMTQFWSLVEKRGADDCWLWTGPTVKGRAVFYPNRKTRMATRWIFEQLNGSLPRTLIALHRCDNPLCCNPAHMFAGTIQDNNRDRDNKGRQARGERHGWAKLTWAQVAEIRALKGTMTQRQIASRFQMNHSTISGILANKNWKI